MKRIEKILGITLPPTVRYPEDCLKIRAELKWLSGITILDAEELWEAFSDSRCAQWLYVDNESLQDFRECIMEEYRGE